MAAKEYKISISPDVDRDLDRIATALQVTKSEVVRRAFALFREAVEADAVKFVKNGEEHNVLIK